MIGLGVDIGKHADYTALAAVILRPRIDDPNLPDPPAMDAGYLKRPRKLIYEYQVPFLERPPLGTDYGVVERRVNNVLKTPQFLEETRLLVDLGEVGDVIFETWRDRYHHDPIGIRIVGGNTVTRTEEGYNVGKPRLLAPMMSVFSQRRIRFANPKLDTPGLEKEQILLRREYLRLRDIMMKELQAMTLEFTKKGNTTLEARGSQHDDLAMALAMPIWYFEHVYKQHFMEGEWDDGDRRNQKLNKPKDFDPLWDDINQ